LLFFRHWLGAIDVSDQQNLDAALRALWGSFFTTASFMTTTGFVSSEWQASQDWSGLPTPGLILMVIASIGGGIATTAGGVKLLRLHALYRHGLGEMERLVHPNRTGVSGNKSTAIRLEGAQLAWIVLMMFVACLALCLLLLTFAGVPFELAVAIGVSALTTTGPLAEAMSLGFEGYSALSDAARAVLCLAMVVGRLETLAVVALLSPRFWSR
jgi:trk system potassium uptake protein TrkH